jgi:hypothetical protein
VVFVIVANRVLALGMHADVVGAATAMRVEIASHEARIQFRCTIRARLRAPTCVNCALSFDDRADGTADLAVVRVLCLVG